MPGYVSSAEMAMLNLFSTKFALSAVMVEMRQGTHSRHSS